MGFGIQLFGSSPFDKLVEKATNESNVNEDWQSILDCCDYINALKTEPQECMKSILKRMSHAHPNVSIQAVILIDACVSNCGKPFHLEVASQEFLSEARKLIDKGHPKIVERLKLMLKKWSENEFKTDPELNSIPSFYTQLVKEGHDFTDPSKPELPKDPNIVISDQEEEDIIKALELSLKDIKSSGRSQTSAHRNDFNSPNTSSGGQLYPSIQSSGVGSSSVQSSRSSGSHQRGNNTTSSASGSTNNVSNSLSDVQGPAETFKVCALYDFEAAEENELTFKAGEIIVVTDARDENWWSGYNLRGEGLFPSNFVTRDLNAQQEINGAVAGKSVQFDEQVRVKFLEEEVTEIDENKIDRLLHLIHEADPTGVTPDSDELIMLEDQCGKMEKLIERELERLDRIQVSLNTANRQVTEAMREYLYVGQ